jgi:hypothetical protein
MDENKPFSYKDFEKDLKLLFNKNGVYANFIGLEILKEDSQKVGSIKDYSGKDFLIKEKPITDARLSFELKITGPIIERYI